MEKQILEIVKGHDDWRHTVEIKDNAKGEPQVTVKSRADESAKFAGTAALAEYKRVHIELKKS